MSHCKCHSELNQKDNCCLLDPTIHHYSEPDNDNKEEPFLNVWLWPGLSFIILVAGLIMEYTGNPRFFQNRWVELGWYILAFIPVGLSVMKEAWEGLLNKDYFNEFTLMTIASIGAFFIGECPEGVAVMLFYCVGEILQDKAVDKVKGNINRLLSLKSAKVTLIEGETKKEVTPEEVKPGNRIQVKPGERVAVDSLLESADTVFDTSALTGESLPRLVKTGDVVLAGMIPLSVAVTLKAEKEYKNSSLSKIIRLVSEAAERKSNYVKFITRFAKVYTPIVILLALALVIIPALVAVVNPGFHYIFSQWFSRALVFLVISCPCALVISVPLGYFVGIGAASRQGILVKGGNYLDLIRDIDTIAFDKTGTLTTGKLTVKDILAGSMTKDTFLSIIASAEEASGHPLAQTIVIYARDLNIPIQPAGEFQEISGLGIIAKVREDKVVAGNLKLLKKEGIRYPSELDELTDTMIVCAIDGRYQGYVTFTDEIKPEAYTALKELKTMGVKQMVMLSGDNQKKVNEVAEAIGIDKAYGELLPEGKADYIKKKAEVPKRKIVYVGDGINDAPVLALSNVGIAMGALGADIAVENSDVIIQTDQLTKIPKLIKIGRTTHAIILENIGFAIAIKVIVLVLGAMGNITLWAAVFADVGVSLIAILNSMRIFWKLAK